MPIRITSDLSTETWQARKGWEDIQGTNCEEYAAENTLSSKVDIPNGEIKGFQDWQGLKEYMTTKPALQEILRGGGGSIKEERVS